MRGLAVGGEGLSYAGRCSDVGCGPGHSPTYPSCPPRHMHVICRLVPYHPRVAFYPCWLCLQLREDSGAGDLEVSHQISKVKTQQVGNMLRSFLLPTHMLLVIHTYMHTNTIILTTIVPRSIAILNQLMYFPFLLHTWCI